MALELPLNSTGATQPPGQGCTKRLTWPKLHRQQVGQLKRPWIVKKGFILSCTSTLCRTHNMYTRSDRSTSAAYLFYNIQKEQKGDLTGLINFIGYVGFRMEDGHSTSLWFMKGPKPWTHCRPEKDSCFSHFLDDSWQHPYFCNKVDLFPKLRGKPKVIRTTNPRTTGTKQNKLYMIILYYTIATDCSEPETN